MLGCRARDGYAEGRRQSMHDGVEAAELVENGFVGHLIMAGVTPRAQLLGDFAQSPRA